MARLGDVETAEAFGGLEEEMRSIAQGAAVFDLWYRPVVSVTGADSTAFLQGMLSQDVRSMAEGTWRWSFLLHPNGKIDSFVRVIRPPGGEGFLLDTDPGYGRGLVASLRRFLIRMDVEIEPAERQGFLRVAGVEAAEVLGEIGVRQIPSGEAIIRTGLEGVDGEVSVLEASHPRGRIPGGTGEVVSYDLLVSEESAAEVWRLLRDKGAAPAGRACLEACRILAGHPALGAELDDKTIVQETGLEGVAVSFEKGCYLGQELVARIDSRGHVNRRLCRIAVHRDPRAAPATTEARFPTPTGATPPPGVATPPPRAEVLSEGKPVGRITSSMSIPGLGPICLGYVRKEVEPGSSIAVVWDGESAEATVESPTRPA